MHASWVLPFALLLVACGDGGQEPGGIPAGGGGAASCAPGESLADDGGCVAAGVQSNGCLAGETLLEEDGACLPAGMQPSGCAAGELTTEAGCQPAGIPPDGCADGFLYDGDGGCDPILPADPCPAGQMATVGETTCRAVAPCGTERWDGIGVAGTTQYVDGGHSGASDGSQALPWTTIQEAIDAAATGSVVAIAAGSYAEDLTLSGKAVKLWGRCPSLVEIAGSAGDAAAVTIGSGADGSELRDLAVTGAAGGVFVTGSSSVLLEAVWFHDFSDSALKATDGSTPTEVTLRDSLVEAAHDQGVWILGAQANVERSVVRGTTPAAHGRGFGLTVEENLATQERASLTLESSLFEDNTQGGVVVHAADAVIRATVIRHTQPDQQGRFGRALMVQTEAAAGGPGVATVSGCVFEHSRDTGIMVHASNVTVESTVVRDTLSSLADERYGNGVVCQYDWLLEQGSSCVIRQSLLERNTENGIFVAGAEAQLEGVLVRDSQPWPDGSVGRGMTVQYDQATDRVALATVEGSRFDGNHDTGLVVDGSDVTLRGSVVSNTQPRPIDGQRGWGLAGQDNSRSHRRATITLRESVLEANHHIGVMLAGSDIAMVGTVVRGTLPVPGAGVMGRGVNLQDSDVTGQRSAFDLRSCELTDNHEAGLVIGGSDGTVESTVVRNTRPEPASGWFGRGIVVQLNSLTAERATTTIRSCLVVDNQDVGILAAGSDVLVESTHVRDTRARDIDGEFGDGLAVVQYGAMASLRVEHSLVETSGRGGLASFSGVVELGSSKVACNVIDLNGETISDQPFMFTDLGNNECGCSDDPMCRVLSSTLEPPGPSTIE